MAKKITHEGGLDLNGFVIPCFVLEDGTRVLSGRGLQEALKVRDKPEEGEKRGGYILPTFLASKGLKPFIDNKLEVAKLEPIICTRGSQKVHGYEATVLADICDAILEARKQGVKLTERQQVVADQCEILVRALAKVGIIALVDEATGYQHEREKDALQKILKAYISEELLKWQKTFPDKYYTEIYRLNGWEFTLKSIKQRPGVVGRWTNKIIYDQLPEGVLKELKEKTPRSAAGNYTAKFFQSLTPDYGSPHLQNQINSIVTLMQISDDWKDFLSKFNKLVDRQKGQLELKFEDLEYKPEKDPLMLKKPIGQTSLFDSHLKGLLAVPPPRKEEEA
ncbi:P63C domain-containing protein [Rufibacter sp. DG15C]|uniref:P63C domain-containing protein n=1 Tax=Rufibacter sp. DG15C TaxID=1379909 RepID=UPI00090069FC|nr:P63C domain-containing protein [Rufibacter sp. DG15C]